MNIKKILYIVLGTIGLILGAIGAVLPLLPAFPFLLLATVCYAKSSKRLHNWFINTKLFKNWHGKYQTPDDLKDWDNAKPVGEELW